LERLHYAWNANTNRCTRTWNDHRLGRLGCIDYPSNGVKFMRTFSVFDFFISFFRLSAVIRIQIRVGLDVEYLILSLELLEVLAIELILGERSLLFLLL
jgi:hypothetical protein